MPKGYTPIAFTAVVPLNFQTIQRGEVWLVSDAPPAEEINARPCVVASLTGRTSSNAAAG